MAFVFGLLAIYQDEQEIVYEQLKEVLEGGRDPVRLSLSVYRMYGLY